MVAFHLESPDEDRGPFPVEPDPPAVPHPGDGGGGGGGGDDAPAQPIKPD